MDIFSVIYDPTTSSTFGVIVEKSDGVRLSYGLSEQGRRWASSNQKNAPEWMIHTGFAPYTKSAQDLISPAIDGETVLSLDEVRNHVSPEMVYVGRTIKKKANLDSRRVFSISSSFGVSKSTISDYLAEKFKSSIKQESVVYEVKSLNVGFSSKINSPKTTSQDPSKTWLIDRVNFFLGRSTSRRMGQKVHSQSFEDYSQNNRINRRVKSLIGNIETDISNYSVPQRISHSGVGRVKRT
jgi:hypothetical protein